MNQNAINASSENYAPNSTKTDLQVNLMSIIRRRFPLLVASAVMGIGCGVAYLMLAPVSYESEAQILLMQNDSGAMVSSVKGESSISEDLLATHMSLLQSQRIIQKALDTRTESVDGKVDPFPAQSIDQMEIVPVSHIQAADTLAKPVNQDVQPQEIQPASVPQEPASVPNSEAFSLDNSISSVNESTEESIVEQLEPTLANLPSILAQLKNEQSATSFVIDRLYVTRGGGGQAKNARILTVSFRHNSPEDAKRIVDAIIAEYSSYVQAKFKDINREAVELIQKARKELEGSIDEHYEKYREFRNSSPILAVSTVGGNVHSMRYEELSQELSKLNLQIDEQTGRLEMVKERLAELQQADALDLEKLALIDLQNAERLGILVTVERGESQTASFQALQPERMAGAQAEYSSILQLKAQLGRALKDYGKQHPAVVNLESQIKEMESFMNSRESQLSVKKGAERELTPDDVMKAYIRLLESDLLAMIRRRQDMEKEIVSVEEQAKGLFDYELREEELSREIKRQEDLYDSVVERLRDINMRQESSNLILEVIQQPEVGRKVSPNAPIAAIITMMSTLVLAGFSVLVAELSDKKVHSAEEVEQVLGARVLAHVMDFQRDAESRKATKEARKSKPDISAEVLSFHAPNLRVCEVYRSIRTELMFQSSSGSTVFGITSPSQGDGKSTSSANLAVSLAKAGNSVLLIDADMRRPSIHKLFNCSSKSGLSEFLAGKAELDAAMTKGLMDNLSVIRAGQADGDAAELLSSKRFADFIAAMKEQYDYVLVDCPPLLPVSDPAIIAPLMDGILMIATTEKLTTQELKQCKRILESKHATLCGVIVNRAQTSNSSYEYAGYLNAAYYGNGGNSF